MNFIVGEGGEPDGRVAGAEVAETAARPPRRTGGSEVIINVQAVGLASHCLAHPLTADVDMPGKVEGGLVPDDAMIGIVFILGHRDADFDDPVIIVNVGGDLGLGQRAVVASR